MKERMKRIALVALSMNMVVLSACGSTKSGAVKPEKLGSGDVKWSSEDTGDGWVRVTNDGGATLGYSEKSGVSLIQVDGYAFKDLDQDGELDVYEDWRQDVDARAKDLASQLTGEEIAPLLTHGGWMSFGTDLGDDEEYLEAGGRAGVTRSAYNEGSTELAVQWNNMLQEYAETNGGHGIPITISTDPYGVSGNINKNGLATTMDPEVALQQGKEFSKEYRAVGITMELGPQIDVASNNSWDRASGSYSEDPALNRDLASAYTSGLQSTYDEAGEDLGWGNQSVAAIVKHFVGAGASEGGRNDHQAIGEYTVFPGDNFEAHLIPFFDGAFNLESKTGKAAGVMPNYAISYSEDGSLGELVGGSYSDLKLGLLRDNDYDGFVLTDWQITNDEGECYGVEDKSEAERFALLFENGADQVGGTTSCDAAIEGYQIMVEDLGEEEALANMQDHARRFFVVQMETGIFENPYLDKEESLAAIWTDETKAVGAETQKGTIVMLKNSDETIKDNTASTEKPKAYIPYVVRQEGNMFTGYTTVAKPMVDLDQAAEYYDVVTDTLKDPSGEDGAYTEADIVRASSSEISACDVALVSMSNPFTDGTADEEDNYLPASLQYAEYTDTTSGDAIANGYKTVEKADGYYGTTKEQVPVNRSTQGHTAPQAQNYSDLETLQFVKKAAGANTKVIVFMGMSSAESMVWTEVEPLADAILLYFEDASFDGTRLYSDDVLLQAAAGKFETSGLLPMQQPASMEAVEAQLEDVPRDVECYVDANGNTYDFAFGLNWSGVIKDERVSTYSADPLTKCETISFSSSK
ncbi:MAG: hypothetical protein IKP29_01900 [Pseudobutyrivibrio sp.]|nr:hypothetical protein [Pseudobutyrivibrio sp.]